MDRVDPRPRFQIDVVGPREEPHEAVLVLFPDFESEFEGFGVDRDVVVRDEDGAGAEEGGGKGEETEVEAGGGLAEDRDGGFGGGGEREVSEE